MDAPGRPDDEQRRPPRLTPGARVAVIAPSSPVYEPSDLERGLAVLTAEFDLSPVLAPGVGQVRGYLAGDDAQRADDLLWALQDESIDAIWCTRGGYGAQRTVAALDPDRLAALHGTPAKPFIGYSDITVLHSLLHQRLGWTTFYGPVVTSLGRRDPYTLQSVRDALFTGEPYTVAAHPDDPFTSTLHPGTAEAPLAGGCLALLAQLAGTPLQVDFTDTICFFEDVNEPSYRIDAALSQLLAAGCFDGCRGIVIGEHADCRAEDAVGLESVFSDLLGPLQIPCCFYLPIGHGTHHATLPIGAPARLDADAGTVEILQAPVR